MNLLCPLSFRSSEPAHDGPLVSPLALGLSTGRPVLTVPHDGAHSVLQHVSVRCFRGTFEVRIQHTPGIVHPYYAVPFPCPSRC
jgi:hypothetical protein